MKDGLASSTHPLAVCPCLGKTVGAEVIVKVFHYSLIHVQSLRHFPMCKQPSLHALIAPVLLCARAHFDACCLSPWPLLTGCRLLQLRLS